MLKLLYTKPLRCMNAYYRVYKDGKYKFIELISYCTPVVWASLDEFDRPLCILFSSYARYSRTTFRHVLTFIRLVLKTSYSIPSKKTLESLTSGEVLYTYPDTNYRQEKGTIDELVFAFGPEPFKAPCPARKTFYSTGYKIERGNWKE